MALKFLRDRQSFIPFLALVFFGVFFYPIAVFPIGGDDLYWIIGTPAWYGNDPLEALHRILSQVYSFEGTQARTTSLTSVLRVWLAMGSINLALLLGVSPNLIWAGSKVLLILITLAVVWIFLSSLRYRSKSGLVRSLGKGTRRVLLAGSIVVLATGLEVNSVGNSNGWIFYPILSYLPLAVYMGIAVLLIKSYELLSSNFLGWILPLTMGLSAAAWAINLSYELWAFSVPFGILVLLLQPNGRDSLLAGPWRAKMTVAGIFGGVYSGIFAWTRIQLGNMECFETGTCYGGTVIDFNLEVVAKNFFAAFPGAGLDWILRFLSDTHPGALIVAVIIVVAIFAGMFMSATVRTIRGSRKTDTEFDNRDEIQPLLWLSALMLFAAVGSATITGITERAAWVLDNPLTPDRSGPTIAVALSISAVSALVVCWRALGTRKPYKYGLLATSVSVVVILAISNFVINWKATSVQLSSPSQVLVDSIYLEFVSGPGVGEVSNLRCHLLQQIPETFPGGRGGRFVYAAQESFDLFWGVQFCPELETQLGED
jgi:hypothetical protein